MKLGFFEMWPFYTVALENAFHLDLYFRLTSSKALNYNEA